MNMKGIHNIILIVTLTFILSLFNFYLVSTVGQPNNSMDSDLPKKYKKGLDEMRNAVQTNFKQLLSIIESQLEFNSIDSHISLAFQHFANANNSEGLSEIEKANKEWHNASIRIIDTGNEFVSIANNSSITMNQSTRSILEHFGTILLDLGTKVENFRLELAK